MSDHHMAERETSGVGAGIEEGNEESSPSVHMVAPPRNPASQPLGYALSS